MKAQKIEAPPKGAKPGLSVVENDEAVAIGAPPRKRRGKMLLLLLLTVLLLGGGGAGAWYFLLGQQEDGEAQAEGEAKPVEAKKPEPPPKPLFVNLDPFTVNLLEENGEHYLQTAIVFQVTDQHAGDAIKLYMPIIRDRVLRILSSKRPSDLLPEAGKQKLAEQLISEARNSVPAEAADKGIINTYFASFVIQ